MLAAPANIVITIMSDYNKQLKKTTNIYHQKVITNLLSTEPDITSSDKTDRAVYFHDNCLPGSIKHAYPINKNLPT